MRKWSFAAVCAALGFAGCAAADGSVLLQGEGNEFSAERRPEAAQKPSGEALSVGIPAIPAWMLSESAGREANDAAARAVASALDASEGLSALQKPGSRRNVRLDDSPVIEIRPGRTHFIPIAVGHPNRIVTPFAHPQVVSTTLQAGAKGDCGEVCARGSVVYVTTNSAEPVSAFITDAGREEVAIALAMIPRRVPPREVRFVFADGAVFGGRRTRLASGGESEGPQPGATPDGLRGVLRAVALGDVPEGFTLRAVREGERLPACRQPGIRFDFRNGQALVGETLTVFVGRATNTGRGAVTFEEERCAGWSTAAVAAWPRATLSSGESTEVYVAVRAAALGSGLGHRPALVGGEARDGLE